MRSQTYFWIPQINGKSHRLVRNIDEAKMLIKQGKSNLVCFEKISSNGETENSGMIYRIDSKLMKYDEIKGKSLQIKW